MSRDNWYPTRREPWPWEAVVDFARRHRIPAAQFRDRQVLAEYWPNGKK